MQTRDRPDARYEELLARARDLAERVLAPRGGETDQGDRVPTGNIRCLAEAGLLGLTTPVEYGGHEAPATVVRALLEILASACGVTVFVVFQHLVACRHIAGSENETLKAGLLPDLAAGRRFCTLAFSHLRRPGPPAVRVEETGDAYRFNGTAPWSTGWGLADDTLLAGTLPDGRSVWVVAPLDEGDTLAASAPMRLCAMTASATVSLTCRDLLVGRERWVKTMTGEQLEGDTAGAILFFSSLSLGAAVGAASLIRTIARSRGSAMLDAAATTLERETDAARAAVDGAAARLTMEEALRVRAWCVDLGVRAAHAAVTASSGRANLIDAPAQRLFREAMVYTLTAQTAELQAATLQRLVRPMQGV